MRNCCAALLLGVAALAAPAAEEASAAKTEASSVVLLAEPRLPPATDLLARLEARLKDRLLVHGMESDGEQVILLRVRSGTVLVGLIAAPLPAGQIDDLCRRAWYWQGACAATAPHRSHAFVSVAGTGLGALEAALLQTDVVAALMEDNGNALASYWGASLHSREEFLRLAAGAGRDNPPAWLWVNFRFSNDVLKGFSVSTQGMEDFGLREIEAKDVNRAGAELFTLVLGMAQYLLREGPVIQDGDTIGEGPAQGIRVRQGPSYWREGQTVYRILFPAE